MINTLIVLLLTVSTINPRANDLWTYTFYVHTPYADTLVDKLDTRLYVVEMSNSCTEAGNFVRCAINADEPTTITITVRIRRNACEPDLCRSYDWLISNYGYLDSGTVSDPVLIDINTSPYNHRKRYAVFVPYIGL